MKAKPSKKTTKATKKAVAKKPVDKKKKGKLTANAS